MFRLILMLGLVPVAVGSALASDGIRRCIGPDGNSIYTDQPCEKFDAVEREPPPVIEPPASAAGTEDSGPIQRDCARRSDTLLFELRRAVESRDVNQLAGLYHWPGISGRGANDIMERLQSLADRPGASVELEYPQITPVLDDPTAFPEGTPPEDPIAVRIIERRPGQDIDEVRQDLGLVRHAECWWIRF